MTAAARRRGRWYARQREAGRVPLIAFIPRDFRDQLTAGARGHRVSRSILVEAALRAGLRQPLPSLIQQIAAGRAKGRAWPLADRSE